MPFPFPKAERLCGKSEIAALLAHGKRGGNGPLRYCCRVSEVGTAGSADGQATAAAGSAQVAGDYAQVVSGDQARILISVPKKYFKRAVKRNLLKRRIREAWRLQKDLLLGPEATARDGACSASEAPVKAGTPSTAEATVRDGACSASEAPVKVGTPSTAEATVMAGTDRPSRRYDILFTYTSPEVAPFETIRAAVAAILTEVR